jgi:peptide/nickel transport system substrate-binding protein
MTSTRERKRPSARAILTALAIIGLIAVMAAGLAACGGDSATGADGEGSAAPATGGVLRIGTQPPVTFDPHFSVAPAEILMTAQVWDKLVTLDGQNEPVPCVATEWTMSDDGKTWTFTLRDDVKFSNGTPLTADDVVYSFDRMRDPKVGTATVALYKQIKTIEAPDPTTVVFTLSTANPEFVKDTADYHACILSKDVKDPEKEWIGSGPFVIKEYKTEDRVVMEKNEHYWGTDADGNKLPYLDGLTWFISPDPGSMVDGLVGGQLDFVSDIAGEHAARIEADPKLKLITSPSNFHFLVHLRSDKPDLPVSKPEVRKALRMGTDYQGLIDLVRPGLAEVGNGTLVGPVYSDYYWDQTPTYDPEGAKQLLADAGYANGFSMKLYAFQMGDAPAFAVAWQEQMAKIGVTVKIESVPTDVYYADDGDACWLTCDYGITNWSNRATPVTYFNLSLVKGALWNEAHWVDPEFDDLTAKINSELDRDKRVELYHQAQEILWERGPSVVLVHENPVAGQTAKLSGVTLSPDVNQTAFVNGRLAK